MQTRLSPAMRAKSWATPASSRRSAIKSPIRPPRRPVASTSSPSCPSTRETLSPLPPAVLMGSTRFTSSTLSGPASG